MRTYDIREDQDGDFYILTENNQVYYLSELKIISIDEINLKIIVSI
jgi:hypothetical protein